MDNLEILYEDNHIIAAVKPAGVLSQGDKTGDVSMLEEVRAYLKKKYHKPGNVFVGLLHRLDRPVSGIMIFAKTSKGASRLSEQFRNREVEKTYHTLVMGQPKKHDTLVNDDMVLHYKLVKPGKYPLLQVQIEGGKYHQIRQQLSKAKMPIVGDVKYGGPAWDNPKAIALCATGISFAAATVDKQINLTIEIPSWSLDNK